MINWIEQTDLTEKWPPVRLFCEYCRSFTTALLNNDYSQPKMDGESKNIIMPLFMYKY